jgi:hypothetical protein
VMIAMTSGDIRLSGKTAYATAARANVTIQAICPGEHMR